MDKVSSYIFKLSPKKMAFYLVLSPLILFLAYIIITITFRTISKSEPIDQITVTVFLGILFVFFGFIITLWLFWMYSTVYHIKEIEIGLPRKWFKIAYVFIWVFIVFNIGEPYFMSFFENSGLDGHQHLIFASREFINFGAIMIAYPIVCNYAARAVIVKKDKRPATFLRAIPFTLALIFGVVLVIPFVHKYFSYKSSKNTEVVLIYAIGVGLVVVIFVIGLIAAITGVV